jgi:O-antigen/teichoic acid export membrane protein
MKINLLKGSVTYGAVTIFSRIASVILIPILTRLLLPVQYGELSMVLTIVTLANFAVTFEVAQAVTFFYTDRNRKNRDLYPSTAFRFSLIMYILLFVIVAIFGEIILNSFANSTINKTIIIAGAILLAVNGIFLFIQNQLRLEFETQRYAFLTFGYVLLTTFGAITGAILYRNSTEAVILGQVTGAAIIDLIGVLILWNRFRSGFKMQKLHEMLKFSIPLVPAALLLITGQQAPKLILSIYGSLSDVGIYGLAYQIAGFSALAVLGVQVAITPAILANHHHAETPKKLGQLFDDFAIVALLFCSFLSIFANELVMIFSVSSYAKAANFVPFLAFSIALNTMYIFFPGKIIRGKSSKQLIVSIGSFLIAVASGLILVKMDGVRGAAISTLLSSITFFLIWCYISQKLYKLPVSWFKLFKALVLTVMVCTVGILFIPAKVTFSIILLKCCILLLFTYAIAWNFILSLWKRYFN